MSDYLNIDIQKEVRKSSRKLLIFADFEERIGEIVEKKE